MAFLDVPERERSGAMVSRTNGECAQQAQDHDRRISTQAAHLALALGDDWREYRQVFPCARGSVNNEMSRTSQWQSDDGERRMVPRTIRGGGDPISSLASKHRKKNGAAASELRRRCALLHHGSGPDRTYRIQGCGAMVCAEWRAPLRSCCFQVRSSSRRLVRDERSAPGANRTRP